MKIYKVTRAGYKAFLEYDKETGYLVRYTNPIVIDENGHPQHTSKAWYDRPRNIGVMSVEELMRMVDGEPVLVINRCGFSYGECAIYCSEKYKPNRIRKGFELVVENRRGG